jgi:hypothetical protein
MKPKPVTKKYIDACLTRWRDRLHLNDWQLQVKYIEVQPPDCPDRAMAVEREPPYRLATVEIYPHVFELLRDSVDQTACHEMGHLIVAPIQDEAMLMFGTDSEIYRRLMYRLEESVDRLAVALWNEMA